MKLPFEPKFIWYNDSYKIPRSITLIEKDLRYVTTMDCKAQDGFICKDFMYLCGEWRKIDKIGGRSLDTSTRICITFYF